MRVNNSFLYKVIKSTKLNILEQVTMIFCRIMSGKCVVLVHVISNLLERVPEVNL